MTKSTLDPAHYHEAMDRAFIQMIQLETALGDHPVIQQQPKIKAQYELIVSQLGDLYQQLGALSADSRENE